VLQVHPDAEAEVIDAAYRQLMKKYHPDLAGSDPAVQSQHLQRATAINEAYRVLRDPEGRRAYDMARIVVGTRPAPSRPSDPAGHGQWAPAPRQPRPPTAAPHPPQRPPAPPENLREDPAAESDSVWSGALGWVAALYYLLPGPYEWEKGRGKDWLIAVLLPVLGTASFALATGRLTPWIGGSLHAAVLAWGVLLVLTLPMWHSLPRVALAAGPSLVMFNRDTSGIFTVAHVPVWLAWMLLGLTSLVLSARLYVFSVLPTLVVCLLISQLT
jgi:hypothetical protein